MSARLQPFFALLVGLALGLGVVALVGENPFHVSLVMAKSAFGSPYDLGMTLLYSTPLIFTGLSVSFAFQAGLFNVGAEGQLMMGALFVALCGVWLPNLPMPFTWIVGTAAGFSGGFLFAALSGWLKAKRGSHEVITTIMLNFIASGITSYVALYVIPNPDSQNPETKAVSGAYLIPKLGVFGDAPVNTALVLALVIATLVWLFFSKTILGFEIRAVGQNIRAARDSGVNVVRARVLAMALSGGIAGLVGVNEVMGSAEKFKVGFSPGYGFTGIAVALLGKNHPIGICAAALLFGALHKGTADLEFETEVVTRDLSGVLQALIILSVSAVTYLEYKKRTKGSRVQ